MLGYILHKYIGIKYALDKDPETHQKIFQMPMLVQDKWGEYNRIMMDEKPERVKPIEKRRQDEIEDLLNYKFENPLKNLKGEGCKQALNKHMYMLHCHIFRK